MAIELIGQTHGSVEGDTSITPVLPEYTEGDFLLAIISRNASETNPFTYNTSVSSIVELAQVGDRRLTALRIVPNGTPPSITLSSVNNSVWTWWIASYRGVDVSATVNKAVSLIGSSTDQNIAIPVTSFDFIATGEELSFGVAAVDSTAEWTPHAETIYSTTDSYAQMMIDAKAPTVGSVCAAFADMSRGLAGVTRSQNSLSFTLQTTPGGQSNLVKNPSFETPGLPATIATDWEGEHTTVAAPTFSLVESGVVDGKRAQKVYYQGQAGDNGGMIEIYQAPIFCSDIVQGSKLTFSVYLSGSLVNTYGIIGVEAFDASYHYINEKDTMFTALSETPTKYTAEYFCPPNTAFVAVYMQCPDFFESSVASVVLDRAVLTLDNNRGNFISFFLT